MIKETARTPVETVGKSCEQDDWERWLSTQVWQINWSKFFPYVYSTSETKAFSVHLSSFERVAPFMAQHATEIYREEEIQHGFLPGEHDPRAIEAKRRFYDLSADIFEIRDEDKIIGILTANPLDWSTYYLRNVSILREYQHQGVFQPFFKHLLAILRQHAVQRAEAEVSPSNFGQVHLLNKLGFNIGGMVLSERWGSMIRFVKFFSEPHEEAYLDQFCYGVRPQLSQCFRSPRVDA